ncbi:Hypothetical predicted protein [Pelobates cultripes]|uniref:Uncharacterized protein n=1 Tax=Pelobates cultripes TaxID=61616 RepID=A0AAD1W3S1_PELCU|nr:Hypothetical predicted protein [Pelobates cultripes]
MGACLIRRPRPRRVPRYRRNHLARDPDRRRWSACRNAAMKTHRARALKASQAYLRRKTPDHMAAEQHALREKRPHTAPRHIPRLGRQDNNETATNPSSSRYLHIMPDCFLHPEGIG